MPAKASVNVRKGKISHISVNDSSVTFTSSTKVNFVHDKVHPSENDLNFGVKKIKVSGGGHILFIQLKGKKSSKKVPKSTKKVLLTKGAKGSKGANFDVPDSGTLLIDLSSPAMTPELKVDYIDDTDPETP